MLFAARRVAGSGQIARRSWPLIIITMYVALRTLWVFIEPRNAPSPLDEMLLVLLFIPACNCALKEWKYARYILPPFVIYSVLGIVSALVAKVPGVPQPAAALFDVVLDAKFPVFVLGFYYLIRRDRDPERSLIAMAYVLVAVALINSPFAVRDAFFSDGHSLRGEELVRRLGFFQPAGLMPHHLESVYVTLFGGLAAWFILKRGGKRIWAAIATFLSILLIIHFSAKEILGYLICCSMLLIGPPHKSPWWVFTFPLTTAAIAFIVFVTPVADVFASQYTQYMGDSRKTAVRSVLTEHASDVALLYFPLGSGAGTYSSPPSVQMGYSSLYYVYGVAKLFGGGPENPNYILDVFWPKPLAQAGFFGILAFFIMILGIFGFSFTRFFSTRSAEAWLCASAGLVTLIASVASTPFTHELFAVVCAFCAAWAAAAPRATRRPRPLMMLSDG